MKQSRNRYTGAAGITQREADTINSCIRKLSKISQKENLYVRHALRLDRATRELSKLLKEADRS